MNGRLHLPLRDQLQVAPVLWQQIRASQRYAYLREPDVSDHAVRQAIMYVYCQGLCWDVALELHRRHGLPLVGSMRTAGRPETVNHVGVLVADQVADIRGLRDQVKWANPWLDWQAGPAVDPVPMQRREIERLAARYRRPRRFAPRVRLGLADYLEAAGWAIDVLGVEAQVQRELERTQLRAAS